MVVKHFLAWGRTFWWYFWCTRWRVDEPDFWRSAVAASSQHLQTSAPCWLTMYPLPCQLTISPNSPTIVFVSTCHATHRSLRRSWSQPWPAKIVYVSASSQTQCQSHIPLLARTFLQFSSSAFSITFHHCSPVLSLFGTSCLYSHHISPHHNILPHLTMCHHFTTLPLAPVACESLTSPPRATSNYFELIV